MIEYHPAPFTPLSADPALVTCRNKANCYTRECDLHGLHKREAVEKVHQLVEFSINDPVNGKSFPCCLFSIYRQTRALQDPETAPGLMLFGASEGHYATAHLLLVRDCAENLIAINHSYIIINRRFWCQLLSVSNFLQIHTGESSLEGARVATTMCQS